jgi:hypothetical protein
MALWVSYLNERLDHLRIVTGVCQEIRLGLPGWMPESSAIANR